MAVLREGSAAGKGRRGQSPGPAADPARTAPALAGVSAVLFLSVPLLNPNPQGCIKCGSNAPNWNNMLPQNWVYILGWGFFFRPLLQRF